VAPTVGLASDMPCIVPPSHSILQLVSAASIWKKSTLEQSPDIVPDIKIVSPGSHSGYNPPAQLGVMEAADRMHTGIVVEVVVGIVVAVVEVVVGIVVEVVVEVVVDVVEVVELVVDVVEVVELVVDVVEVVGIVVVDTIAAPEHA
jgi:hypothetical protein